jgi:hypothetical protein
MASTLGGVVAVFDLRPPLFVLLGFTLVHLRISA